MKKLLSPLLVLGILLACNEKYSVPIRAESSNLVVDGGINSGKPPYTIKLSYSGIFEYASKTEGNKAEPNAKIIVSDDKGNSTGFRYIGNGNYRSTNLGFRGTVGQSYTLNIELPDGQKFRSFPEKMPASVPIKAVYGEFKKKETIEVDFFNIERYDPSIPPTYPSTGQITYVTEPNGPSGFQVYVDTQDPIGTERNYYRWTASTITRRETTGRCQQIAFMRYCCNCIYGETCFVPQDHTNLNLFSDQLTDGNLIRRRPIVVVPIFTSGRMYFEINQLSYTREAYQFWKRYEEQLIRTGTILDPLPAPIEGNIYNVNKPSELALGYFSAAGVFKKREIIPVQLLDFQLFPRGTTRRRGTCMEIYGSQGAYDVDDWPKPNWETEELNN